MKRKSKYQVVVVLTPIVLLVIIGLLPASSKSDPEDWTKVIISDTIDVPINDLWDLSGKVNLEDLAGGRKYENLPKIIRTKPVVGDFSREGDSRIVYFSSGDTLVETIIAKSPPIKFGYEITKPSLPMRHAAYRARGVFDYAALSEASTIVVWTYYFQHKNFVTQIFLRRYINKTHRQWMKDMLTTTKIQTEKMYASQKQILP